MTPLPSNDSRAAVVVISTKSVGVAILLTLFLGPVGLFYATVRGALVTLLGIPAAFVALGIGLASVGAARQDGMWLLGAMVLVPLCAAAMWIASLVWAVVAVNGFNRRLLAGTT